MKNVYILIFLLAAATSKIFAQGGQVYNLNKLPAQDTLLSRWKFHEGDNFQWSTPAFDDTKWTNKDPAQDVTEFNALKNAGTGWLRLHIRPDSNLSHQQLTAHVFQYTASEIYLDGRLIKKYGEISKNTAQTIAFSPDGDLFKLPLKTGVTHVIAVRLGYQSGLPYSSPFFTPLSAFCLYLNSYDAAQANIRQSNNATLKSLILCGTFSGMLFIISLIYLFYYIFERKQRVNLYYSVSCALFFLLDLGLTFFIYNIERVSTQTRLAYLMDVLFVCSAISMVLTIYTLFAYKKKPVFIAIIIIGIAALVYALFSDIIGFVLATNVYLALCTLEGVHISRWAIRLQKKGAKIIFWGFISILVLDIWSALLPQANFSSQVLGLLATLGFPLGMSIYLAIQNAITYQTLSSTLLKVQLLSEQNLIKEQEKQQILAEQNVVLELLVTERTGELNRSLTNLQSTQTQLIQKEKMASLGELTAGIAHEIQNPLNFVNNFSEVNIELIDEMHQEIDKGDYKEVKAIANDIKENQQKISQHGKRADFIVKGMLQHSRTSTGERQLTNINLLADEFFKLSYHGLRAKDKSFNADLVTNFDDDLPKVNIVQQDIGRVLLNLFNNAFYAVNQKNKTAEPDFKPKVEVTTSAKNGIVEISVKDNGNGIPKTIKDKIMQPFFTTKPTGEGTGLGLSLSYDIIVKGHGGEIKVKSKEGEGSEFIMILPLT